MYRNYFNGNVYSEEEMAAIGRLLGFNAEIYGAKYPDVLAAGIDPLRHFLNDGMYEGRSCWEEGDGTGVPGHRSLREIIGFSEEFYAAKYPDVPEPRFGHFLHHGMREQRQPFNFYDNVEPERLLWEVMTKHGMDAISSFDRQLAFSIDDPDAVIEDLLGQARRKMIIPHTYRNNFWMLLAICYMAKNFYGAAQVCYSYFYLYFVPQPSLRNAEDGIYVTGKAIRCTDYARARGLPLRQLSVDSSVTVPDPVFLNRPNGVLEAVEMPLPVPYYTVFNDVVVIGGNSMMIAGTHEFLYDYLDETNDDRQAEFKGPNILHRIGDSCTIKYKHTDLYVDEAFSLLHDHGHNYFHWMVEVLPRFLLARRNGLATKVTVLINEQIGHLQEDVLRHVLGPHAELIKVPRNATVRVGTLHWVSDLSVNTVHTLHLPQKSDILISPTALSLLREMAEPFFVAGIARCEKMQIVRHNVEFRRLVNREALRTMLTNCGYWGFDPGQAKFELQVRAFANARIVVAEAGAALANIVFCQPGSVVCVLVNGYKNSNYYYLAEMANALNIRLVFFECLRLEGSHALGVHDDMVVHVSALVEGLRAIESVAPTRAMSPPVRSAKVKVKPGKAPAVKMSMI